MIFSSHTAEIQLYINLLVSYEPSQALLIIQFFLINPLNVGKWRIEDTFLVTVDGLLNIDPGFEIGSSVAFHQIFNRFMEK